MNLLTLIVALALTGLAAARLRGATAGPLRASVGTGYGVEALSAVYALGRTDCSANLF